MRRATLADLDLLRRWNRDPDVMRAALARCFANPRVTAVLIDPLASNVRARHFYERLGFRAVGPRRFGSDDCVVYRISRDAWLTQIGAKSPQS